jgi:hypothetical protein
VLVRVAIKSAARVASRAVVGSAVIVHDQHRTLIAKEGAIIAKTTYREWLAR